MTIADIEHKREKLGMAQLELARRAKVFQPTLTDAKRGRIVFADETLQKLNGIIDEWAAERDAETKLAKAA